MKALWQSSKKVWTTKRVYACGGVAGVSEFGLFRVEKFRTLMRSISASSVDANFFKFRTHLITIWAHEKSI